MKVAVLKGGRSLERTVSLRSGARVAQRVLGNDLVHAAHAGRRARGRVGDPEQLEQLLDRPVLAAAAVQRHERDVGALGRQPVHEVRADVDRDGLVAEPLQRVLDPRARAQGDLSFERVAALEDRDLHPALRRSGRTWESGACSSRGAGSEARGFAGAVPVRRP